MEKAGTLDKAEFPGKLDKVAVMTAKQATDAGTLLGTKWANAVG
jgi:putative spermidine/putrescine transport system substrate-binding protein